MTNKIIHYLFIAFITTQIISIYFRPEIALSQNSVIDSLENELQNNDQPDRYMFDLYYYLSKNYRDVDIDKSTEIAQKLLKITLDNDSLYYATYALDLIITNYEQHNQFDSCVKYLNEVIQISKDLKKPHDVAYFQSRLGNSQVKHGNYYDALQNYEDAVEFSKTDSSLIKYEMAFLTNIGGIYHYLGDDLKALDYFLQSYYLKTENNLTDNLSPSLMNIASVYSKLEKFEEAIDFHLEALDLAKQDKDQYYQVKALTGLGYDYYLQQEYDTSLAYYQEALVLSDSVSDQTAKANIMAKICTVYHETGDTDNAIEYAQEALKLSREINYQYGISSFSRTLGDIYLTENKYRLALVLFQESIEVSNKIGAMEELQDSYYSIFILYEKINEVDKSLKYYKLYSSIRDSLLKHEEADKFTVVEIKYEMEKKAREVENLTAENEINELKLRKIETRNKFFIGISVLAFIIVYLIYRMLRFSKRTNKILVKQNNEIERQRDEIDHERKRSDKLLLNILPKETADELKENGAATPKHYELVSVLFTDFVGFTNIAEKLTPQELVKELDKCFLEFDKIIDKHNLEKIKTIGDAYMCAGGIPVTNTTNPVDIVEAGLEIKNFMQKLKSGKESAGEDFWELRIGIHTGQVIAGVVGKNKFAYDIWGDAVNTASRMESSGVPGKVNISGETYNLINNKFNCTYRGKIKAKNKGEIDMYIVEGKR